MIPQSEFGDLVGIVVDMRREIAQLKRELANMVKVGTVSDVDAKKGYRLDFGQDENGQPKKSAWLPHPESGGAAKSWIPLSVGQTAAMVTPPGDTRQGFLVRGGFSDKNPQPSENTDENVFTFGPWRISLDAGVLSVTGPKVKVKGDVEIEGAVDIKGERVTHNKKNIDASHKHKGVVPGGGETGVPV